MKTEAELKRTLVKLLRETYPNWVIWRIEDPTTSGIPDIEINGKKFTSHWEVKHATPKFNVKGIQGRTMDLLAREGYARFIVYWERNGEMLTFIVEPKDIHNPTETWPMFVHGFDHEWIVRQIGEAHDHIRS